MQTATLPHNIRLIAWHKMLREMGFLTSVYVLFAAWRGVSLAEFMVIQGIFVLAMLLSDPFISPLADKYGRKPVLFAGSLLWMVGHIFIGFGFGWNSFVVGEVLLGLGAACNRSASEALLYDTLLAEGRAEEHQDIQARQWRIASYAAGITMVVGAVLYQVSPYIPATLTVVFTAVLPFIALRTKEVHLTDNTTRPTYRQIVRAAWSNLASPATRWLVLVPAFIGGSTAVLFWSIQPVFTGQGVAMWLLGGLMALHFYLRGVSAGLCPRLVRRYGAHASFAMCVVAMLSGFLAMAFAPWWVAYPFFVVGTGFTYMMTETLGKDLLQRSVKSSYRSASLGGYQAIGRIIGASAMFGFPALQVAFGMPVALTALGLTAAAAAAFSLSRLRVV